MEITILGSGTGAPSLNRGASGLLVKIKNANLLFDTGPGILRKLLEVGVTYHDLDYIFYTHFHTDHTLDLAAILFAAKYSVSLRTRKLDIIAAEGLERFYNSLLAVYGDVIRPENYEVNLRQIREQTLNLGSCRIKTLRMQHTPESLGYRVESGGKTVVYSGDTDSCENIVALGENADALILDCSFPDQMKVVGHLVPQEAATVAKRCNCKRLILSHLYPVCDNIDIAEEAKKIFKGEVIVASDLMTLEV